MTLIQAYLQEVRSSLFEKSSRIPFIDLCRQMAIVRGPDEYPCPVNIGLLLFHELPESFFPQARIEIVIHKDDSGRNYIEKVFTGPIHHQLRNTLDFIKTMVIQEKVIKVKEKAEALRFYNYPFEAIEEVIANAVYHKGYDHNNPIEIQIHPDRMEVLNFPGPMPPIDLEMLKLQRVVARQYRNRRIGDFLKELHLIEGRSSGFPLIHRTLEHNGSPPPEFKTDDDKSYFLAVIKSHSAFIGTGISNQDIETFEIPEKLLDVNDIEDVKRLIKYYVTARVDRVSDKVYDKVNDKVNDRVSDRVSDTAGDKVRKVIGMSIVPQSREKLLNMIGLKNHPDNYNRYIKPLIEEGWLEMTEIDLTSRNQKYRATKSGKILLQLISKTL